MPVILWKLSRFNIGYCMILNLPPLSSSCIRQMAPPASAPFARGRHFRLRTTWFNAAAWFRSCILVDCSEARVFPLSSSALTCFHGLINDMHHWENNPPQNVPMFFPLSVQTNSLHIPAQPFGSFWVLEVCCKCSAPWMKSPPQLCNRMFSENFVPKNYIIFRNCTEKLPKA